MLAAIPPHLNLAEWRVLHFCDEGDYTNSKRAEMLPQMVAHRQVWIGNVMPRLGERLCELARDADEVVRSQATQTMALMGVRARGGERRWADSGVRPWLKAGGVDTLVSALPDASPRARASAARAISDLGGDAALMKTWRTTPVLQRLLSGLRDQQTTIVEASCAALGTLTVHARIREDFVALDGVGALLIAGDHADLDAAAGALLALVPMCLDARLRPSLRALGVLEQLTARTRERAPGCVNAALQGLDALLLDNPVDVARFSVGDRDRLIEISRAEVQGDGISRLAQAVLSRLTGQPTPDEIEAWVDQHT